MTEIGNAYGKALFLLCQEEGVDGEVLSQLREVCALLKDNPDYVRLMTTPDLSRDKRGGILEETFGGSVHEYLLSFMCILAENGTFEELPSCEQQYIKLYNAAHGIIEAVAVSAVPINGDQLAVLAERLGKKLHSKIELSCRIDPSCIGGVRLEMDGQSFDGSVRARLDAIKDSLLNAKA